MSYSRVFVIDQDENERAVAEQAEQLAGQQVQDQEDADLAELLDLSALLRMAESQNAVLNAQMDDRRQGMEIRSDIARHWKRAEFGNDIAL